MPPARKGNTKSTDIPGTEDIRRLCNAQTYNEGKRIYEAGNVTKAHILKESASASVYDNEEDKEHDVNISVERGYMLYTECTCTVSYVYRSICKHVVATIFHVNEDATDIDLYGGVTEETVSSLLDRIPPEQVIAFVAKMMASNKHVLHRFITENELRPEYGISKYEGDLASMYNHAVKSDGKIIQMLDFEVHFNEARRNRTEGKHADAIRMYRAISEAISDRMGDVSDDSGYYADCFVEALEGMVECILRERPQHEKKREYISYMFEKAAAARGAGFSKHYRAALEDICSKDADLEFWQEIIDNTSEDELSGEGLAEMLRMRAHILRQQGRHADTAALLGKHYSLHSDICVQYLEALQRSAAAADDAGVDYNDDVESHAARATEAFPDDPKVLEAAFAVMPDKAGKGSRILERLYAITDDWSHIIRLKHVLSDWGEARDGIVERLEKMSPKNAVNLCVKEDMPDRAMEVLKSAADMELLASYKTKIARKRPKEYSSYYASLLIKFTGSKSGKDHYKHVLEHLTTLKDMPGGRDHYEPTLNKIRKEYSGRRALIKELAGL